MISVCAVNVCYSESQDIRYNIRGNIGDHEHTHPPLQMDRWIIERANENTSRYEASIEDSYEEPSRKNSCIAFVETLSQSHHTCRVGQLKFRFRFRDTVNYPEEW